MEAILKIENGNSKFITEHDLSCFLTNLERKIEDIKEELNKNEIYNFLEHGERIFEPTLNLAFEITRSYTEALFIAYAAQLHDIGKYRLPKQTLCKVDELTKEEINEFRKHAEYGEQFLSFLPKFSKLVRHHHEWYNGEGYPDKLKGDEIPLGSKIIAVTECWDAMTFPRPYCITKTPEQAKKELKKYAGIQFDPKIVDIFLKIGSTGNKGYSI